MQLRQTFSINLPIDLYQELTNKAGKGKISKFIKELLERELKKDKANLAREYQECYTKNSRLLEEAKQWEKAEIESWLNYERNKKAKK